MTDGGLLRFRRTDPPRHAPDAPVVVLLPGLALSGHYMLPLAAQLSLRYAVRVPDLPDHVHRRPGRAPLRMSQLADALDGWLERAGVAQAVLVGNSMGCQVAFEMAARHPARVSCIVAEGPTIDPQGRTLPRQLGRLLLAGRREPVSLGPLQVVDWSTLYGRDLVAMVRMAFAHRVEDRLPSVGCPALVVRGARDPIVPQRWAEEVVQRLPKGRLVVVPDTSHALTYSHPAILSRLIERFLAERHR